MALRVGLIGHPVGHSISPAFQQAALDACGIAGRYEAWDVAPEDLAEAIEGLRGEEALGANVTIPYKEAALRHMDGLHQTARFAGAINTVVNQAGHLQGYNTDVTGFQRSLAEAGFDPAGKSALIWGAGGAARAVAWGLVWREIASITIVNRTATRAGRLRHDMASASAGVQLRSFGADSAEAAEALGRAELVVQCTSVGLAGSEAAGEAPFDAGLLGEGAFVFDLVANPERTPLVEAALGRGLKAVGGLPMLVWQGAAAFELWTGERAPGELMMAAAREAMAGVAP